MSQTLKDRFQSSLAKSLLNLRKLVMPVFALVVVEVGQMAIEAAERLVAARSLVRLLEEPASVLLRLALTEVRIARLMGDGSGDAGSF